MNARAVGGPPHDAIQCIDLTHKVALADAANRRIARHLSDTIEPVCEQQCPRAHACRRRRRFCSRMAASDHNNIVSVVKQNVSLRSFLRQEQGGFRAVPRKESSSFLKKRTKKLLSV
jgi:hypothetical protein